MDSDSELVSKGPCDNCGSSDACALYDDGHTFCFVCHTHTNGEGASAAPTRAPDSGLLQFTPTELTRRGLRQETCAKWKYGVAKFKGQDVQVATYCDDQGVPISQKVRFASKDFLRLGETKKLPLYGQWLWRNGGRMVVVTEGEIDALTVSQLQGLKWPVVSVPDGASGALKAVQHNLEWLETFDSVVFMFDMDQPGQAAAQECALALTPGKAKIATLPGKDPNELLKAGRGKEVIAAMWGAKEYRPDGIITGSEVLDLMRSRKKCRAIGHYPLHRLDQETRGIRGGEIVLVTAGSGVGKTEFVRELAAALREQKLRLGYIALEESCDRTALGLVGMRMNTPLHFEEDPEGLDGFAEAWEHVVGEDQILFYDHFGSLDGTNLIQKMRYMRVGMQVDCIILDHVSIVVSGMEDGDERRTIDTLMTKLRSFAEETGVSLIIVSHLKRPEGVPHEEGGKTRLGQLRGSASLGQLSDIVIGLERNQQDEERKHLTTVRLLKNRWTGYTGFAGIMEYHPDTGRLTERQHLGKEF